MAGSVAVSQEVSQITSKLRLRLRKAQELNKSSNGAEQVMQSTKGAGDIPLNEPVNGAGTLKSLFAASFPVFSKKVCQCFGKNK